MSQNLAAVFSITDRYSTAITRIMKSQDSFERKQASIDRATEVFNKRMGTLKNHAGSAAGGIDSLAGRIAGLVSVTYLAKKAFDGMFGAINLSALQKVQETTFQALLNSEQAGTKLYQYVGAYAKISALGREDIAKGVTSFLTVTRDMAQVEQLIKMTERLYAKDPTQGAEGAVFALKEALAGDTISLRNRYGITGLSGEDLRAGDTTSKLAQIDAALNRFGATQAVVDKNFTGLLTQTNIFTSNLKTAIGEQAAPVMEKLAEVALRLNDNMEAGKYQPFINLMVNGMELIGNGIAFVADNANWLIPVVGGVVMAIIAYNAAMAVANTVTLLMGVSLSAVTGNWIKVGAIVAGVAGAAALVSASMKDIDSSIANSATGLEGMKNAAGTALKGTKLPVEITNTDPVKVTGEVDIEKENLKYLMDIAGAKFFAKFSTATLAPQVNIYGQTIEKTADVNEITGALVSGLSYAVQSTAKGLA